MKNLKDVKEMMTNFAVKPFVTMKENEEEIVHCYMNCMNNAIAKKMYYSYFETVKAGHPKLIDDIATKAHYRNIGHEEAMQKLKEAEDAKPKKNFPNYEKLVACAFVNMCRSQLDATYYYDNHVSMKENLDELDGRRRAESDLFIDTGKNKYVVLMDGFFHKHSEKTPDDIHRNKIFENAGCEVIRVREEGLPKMDGKNIINLDRRFSSNDEGCVKEAVMKLLHYFSSKEEFTGLHYDNIIFETCKANLNEKYKETFTGREFQASIPEDLHEEFLTVTKKLLELKGVKAKEERAELKDTLKRMNLSRNVKETFKTAMPENYAVAKYVLH